jgi:hypothetical protein
MSAGEVERGGRGKRPKIPVDSCAGEFHGARGLGKAVKADGSISNLGCFLVFISVG